MFYFRFLNKASKSHNILIKFFKNKNKHNSTTNFKKLPHITNHINYTTINHYNTVTNTINSNSSFHTKIPNDLKIQSFNKENFSIGNLNTSFRVRSINSQNTKAKVDENSLSMGSGHYVSSKYLKSVNEKEIHAIPIKIDSLPYVDIFSKKELTVYPNFGNLEVENDLLEVSNLSSGRFSFNENMQNDKKKIENFHNEIQHVNDDEVEIVSITNITQYNIAVNNFKVIERQISKIKNDLKEKVNLDVGLVMLDA